VKTVIKPHLPTLCTRWYSTCITDFISQTTSASSATPSASPRPVARRCPRQVLGPRARTRQSPSRLTGAEMLSRAATPPLRESVDLTETFTVGSVLFYLHVLHLVIEHNLNSFVT